MGRDDSREFVMMRATACPVDAMWAWGSGPLRRRCRAYGRCATQGSGRGARRQVEQTDARVCAALVDKDEETGVVGRSPVLSLSSSRVSKGPDRQGAA
ncbi:hypothetical protein GT037_004756 [Alternaria burnsii]|uniref:Uncharacterized protein n=1 Tax=Alternaria burnsii TaxID=1187904 RepID=A0A8H7B9M3_9PLEO|nr:uncharacterized protein GT037_004756 [Alternaria burnsii]KAF7677897.1 hypothetical protein GT037_004756 [Alternaria burnsii]